MSWKEQVLLTGFLHYCSTPSYWGYLGRRPWDLLSELSWGLRDPRTEGDFGGVIGLGEALDPWTGDEADNAIGTATGTPKELLAPDSSTVSTTETYEETVGRPAFALTALSLSWRLTTSSVKTTAVPKGGTGGAFSTATSLLPDDSVQALGTYSPRNVRSLNSFCFLAAFSPSLTPSPLWTIWWRRRFPWIHSNGPILSYSLTKSLAQCADDPPRSPRYQSKC